MCENYTLFLSAYVDDEVNPTERAWVEGHLKGCADCRAELQALREAAQFASLLPEVLPPPDLRSQILLRTSRRPGFWPRVRTALHRPAVWSPALAAGVVGIVVLASQSGKSPAPTASPSAPPARPAPLATAPRPAPAPTAPLATAPLPQPEDETGIKGIMQRLEETLTAQPEPAPVLPPAASAPPRQMAKASPVKEKPSGTPAPPKVVRSAPAAPPMQGDPLRRMKTTLASVGKTIQGKLLDKSSRKTAPKAVPAERTPENMPPNEEESTLAMEPPMVYMPEMTAPTAPSSPAKEAVASEEPTRPARTSNPLAEGLVKLAEPPKKKRTDMDDMVEQINANALSTAATARQVKWNFARHKF
ncbi:MAG: zf-HC2 domain-containing protein [Armatimonadetes bacterium]|nr:zf-HC2 domain-containing protein [Armatimonadota bacterium]